MKTSDNKGMTKGAKIDFTLRIPDLIDEKIANASSDMGVSKNAFILMVLSEKFTKERVSN